MNKRSGIVWLPLLIIVATLVVVGIVTYGVVQTKNENKSKNANTTANTAVVNRSNANSVANRNVNAGANVNSAANANSAVPAGWKTYTNTAYGFSFQYPADETVNELSEQGYPTVQLLNEGTLFYRLRITGTTNPVESNIVSNPECYREVESAMEAGDWKKYDFSCGISGTQTRYSLTRGTSVYEFSLPGGVPGTLEQILETFRFSDATAGWKTYTNVSYGYSVQYPPAWEALDPYTAHNDVTLRGTVSGTTESLTISAKTETSSAYLTTLASQVTISKQESTTVGGRSATKVTLMAPMRGTTTIYYVVSLDTGSIVLMDVETSTKEQILSTFQFTE